MSHHQDHEHPHEIKSELSFVQKMRKLLQHWIKHNNDHAATYRKWADQARLQGLGEVASILEEVFQATMTVNQRFDHALRTLDASDGPPKEL